MGQAFFEHGTDLAEDKVDTILNARQTESVTKIRSFLELINFSARFIPNLATILEPLRKLTRKGVPFI